MVYKCPTHLVGLIPFSWTLTGKNINYIGLQEIPQIFLILKSRDFPGGPVVKNPSCNAKDKGLSPGWGTKISYVLEELRVGCLMQPSKYFKK